MKCGRCDKDGWLEPIGPCRDGSYITSRPCPNGCAIDIEIARRDEAERNKRKESKNGP